MRPLTSDKRSLQALWIGYFEAKSPCILVFRHLSGPATEIGCTDEIEYTAFTASYGGATEHLSAQMTLQEMSYRSFISLASSARRIRSCGVARVRRPGRPLFLPALQTYIGLFRRFDFVFSSLYVNTVENTYRATNK